MNENGKKFNLQWIEKERIRYISIPDLLSLVGHMRLLDFNKQRESVDILYEDLINVLKIEVKDEK